MLEQEYFKKEMRMNKVVLQLIMIVVILQSNIAWGMDLTNSLPTLCRTDRENVQSLAFNAAWNGDFARLTKMIKHMEQKDYKYDYSIPFDSQSNSFVYFDLLSIIKARIPNQQYQIARDARKNGCKLDFYNYGSVNCNAMKMACYNRDCSELEKYAIPDTGKSEWQHLMGIAISRNANQCVDLLCRRKIQSINNIFMADFFLGLLKMLMDQDKLCTFQIIVKNDPLNCLNFVFEHEGKMVTYESVLDRLILFSKNKPEQQKYIEIYKECGGKRNKELGQHEHEKCIIS